jgi:hypothetical protein
MMLGHDWEPDPVFHPSYYTSSPSGIECIQVVEHMTFNLGNAVKYLWRAGKKGTPIEDLRKALWYIAREIMRLSEETGEPVADLHDPNAVLDQAPHVACELLEKELRESVGSLQAQLSAQMTANVRLQEELVRQRERAR